MSSFFATYGFNPRLGIEPIDSTRVPGDRNAEDYASNMSNIIDYLRDELKLAQA